MSRSSAVRKTDVSPESRGPDTSGLLDVNVDRQRRRGRGTLSNATGRYEPLAPGPDGIYRSEVFPGLWLDPQALIRFDRAALARGIQQGTASPEHAAFVQRLAGRA